MNLSTDIITALHSAGVESFPPGMHTGICTSPYTVVQSGPAQSLCRTGGQCLYRVHAFVPAFSPSKLDELCGKVYAALGGMTSSGRLRLTLRRSAAVINERFSAVCCYIEYVSEYRS